MLADTRIISRHKDFAVLQERQAVVFPDNSIVYLHQVQRSFVDKRGEKAALVGAHLRALCLDGAHWCVFDLTSIHAGIALDFAALPPRDHPGIVLYTLRAHFASRAQFIAKAFAEFTHVWTEPTADAEPLIIAGDAHRGRVTLQPELPRAA